MTAQEALEYGLIDKVISSRAEIADFKSQQSKKFITSLWRTF